MRLTIEVSCLTEDLTAWMLAFYAAVPWSVRRDFVYVWLWTCEERHSMTTAASRRGIAPPLQSRKAADILADSNVVNLSWTGKYVSKSVVVEPIEINW